MRLLLDTHVALWAITNSPKLSDRGREFIGDGANEVFVSAASIWEIAIKRALNRSGPGAMQISAADAVRYFQQAGFELLLVSSVHACRVETLPRLHSDPFDRMLIAQALSEPMYLLTHDKRIASYGEGIFPV
ncbi:MAG: type II toxin-antitoxin system VapC family toxin [Pseudomonadota bacterium]